MKTILITSLVTAALLTGVSAANIKPHGAYEESFYKAMYMVDLKARCGLLTHRQYKNMLKYLTGEFSSIGFSMLYDLRKTAVADVSKIYSKDFCKKHQILIDG